MTATDWLTTAEATALIFAKEPGDKGYRGAYRRTLGLVQDRKLTYRPINPDAPQRRIYLIERASVDKYIANTTRNAA